MKQYQIKSTSLHTVGFTGVFLLAAVLLIIVTTLAARIAHAADTNLTNGITVDSTLDTPDDTVGDGICDDGDGNCTLRAAIEEANSDPDVSIINFNIAPLDGTVKTISPATPLPDINEQVTIDGFTQDDAQPNTTVSPNPFDAILRIEIDGTNTPINTGGCIKVVDADNVVIKGLVIHSCANDGIRADRSEGLEVKGNYLGTDPTGMTDQGNGRDYMASSIGNGLFMNSVSGAQIGGADPADRNIISGNQAGDIFWGNEQQNAQLSGQNVLQGNYIGLASDGLTPLPSGYIWGLGNALLMGNSHDDIIGGDGVGEGNVIASSAEYGIGFRAGCTGTIIQGNYIGTDYTTEAAPDHAFGSGHATAGIHVGSVSHLFPDFPPSHDIIIGGSTPLAGNVVSGTKSNQGGGYYRDGIIINDGAYNVTVQGNKIGTDKTGTIAVPNGAGVTVDNVQGFPEVKDILIGGSGANEGNIIAENVFNGVLILGSSDLEQISVLGNTIRDNGHLGINLNEADSYSDTDQVVTPNDPLDPDIGPNAFLNFPEYTSVQEDSGNTVVKYFLDVPAGDYRIEFFSNSSPDPSGNGEGEEYLGFQNVSSSGSGEQLFEHTLAGVTGVTNLSMTTTEIDGSPDGFGSTSEFGGEYAGDTPALDLSVEKTVVNPDDVAPGTSIKYRLTLSQLGYQPFNLDTLDGTDPNPFAANVFGDFLPPQLTYVGSSNPDINCTDAGPIPAGTIANNHTGWHLILCSYAGPGKILEMGESISTQLEATVAQGAELEFTNYLLGPIVEDEVGSSVVLTALTDTSIGAGTPDLIDELVANPTNNFAANTYTAPPDSGGPPEQNDGSSQSSLASTGANAKTAPVAALLLVGVSLGAIVVRQRHIGLVV